MPTAKNPEKAEFFVYRLVADGVPFYVGIGRSARASDRVRYIRYLMSREAQDKPVKWGLSARVIAALIRAGCDVQVMYPASGLTRADALEQECAEIENLLALGFLLANIQHNSNRPSSHEPVVESVLARCGKQTPNFSLNADARLWPLCGPPLAGQL